MIKKLLFGILVLTVVQGSSQILNPGFESVTAGKPNNYNQGPVYSLYPIRDTSASRTGLHAGAIYGSVPPAYPGAIINEHTLGPNLPTSLTGWYKFSPQLGDSLVFTLGVYKTGDIANYAPNVPAYIITPAVVYTQFTVAIDYTSYGYTTCDSAFIIIYPTGNVSSGGYNWAHPGTVAIFDDLAWTFTTTAVAEINKSMLLNIENVQPNPVKDYANIVYTLAEPNTVTLKLFDVTGKELLKPINNEHQLKGRYKAELAMDDLPAGVYLYQFSTSSGFTVTKKLIKQ